MSLLSDWPNTYSFTKAVSEEVVRVHGSGLPICIYRPAIGKHFSLLICSLSVKLCTYLVTAANQEPIAGWIDNINGPSGVIYGVGLGVLKVVKADYKCVAEMVPVDLVVNSMIAISAKIKYVIPKKRNQNFDFDNFSFSQKKCTYSNLQLRFIAAKSNHVERCQALLL